MRFWRLAVVCAAMLAVAGCGASDELLNSCPRVTGATVVSWDGAELKVGVWLQDLEEDSVDLLVTDGNGEAIDEVLGHGGVGLTSTAELPGAGHELLIAGKHVKGSSMGFQPVDIQGCQGEEFRIDIPAVGGGR